MSEIMQGIEVLNEINEVKNIYSPLLMSFFICGLVFLVSFLLLLSLQDSDIRDITTFCAISCVVCFIVFVGYVAFPTKAETKLYEVTISDQVKFTDFNSRYEVVKQEGKIYTIKIK